MNIEQRRISTECEVGNPLETGFSWEQTIAWRERCIYRSLCTSFVAAAATYPVFHVWLNHKGQASIDVLAFVVLATFVIGASIFALLFIFLLFGFFGWTAERVAVMFTVRDEIWVTKPRQLFQKYNSLEWMCLRLGASEITSIEYVPMKNNAGGPYKHSGDDGYFAFDVCIYFMNGERFWVASYLDESHASIVQAQLNMSLKKSQFFATRTA